MDSSYFWWLGNQKIVSKNIWLVEVICFYIKGLMAYWYYRHKIGNHTSVKRTCTPYTDKTMREYVMDQMILNRC